VSEAAIFASEPIISFSCIEKFLPIPVYQRMKPRNNLRTPSDTAFALWMRSQFFSDDTK
jgi:hypothetical protein